MLNKNSGLSLEGYFWRTFKSFYEQTKMQRAHTAIQAFYFETNLKLN